MIRLNWQGGEHDFLLPLGEIRALQDSCDAGPEKIYRALYEGTWRIDYVYDTLRLGLIGAGMNREEAGKIVAKAWDQSGAMALKTTALALMHKTLIPEKDDPLGEQEAAESPESLKS